MTFDQIDLFGTRVLDIDIEEARTKKDVVESKMDSIIRLMREVELREKDAKIAQQEVDDCSLDILAEIDELIIAQQLAKKINDERAREVYAQKADLAAEMKALQFHVSVVLDEGDGCLAAIDEIYKSLEKRLTSAVKQKETAEKEKLQKEATLAFQKSEMTKLVEESKKLEEQAMENLKLQEFLIDRGHVVDMLKEEISCKCQDVNLLKVELEDYQDASGTSVTEDYLSPIEQNMISMQDCKCYKCDNNLNGVERRFVASKDEMKAKKICKSLMKNLKKKDMKKWLLGEITEAVEDHEDNYF